MKKLLISLYLMIVLCIFPFSDMIFAEESGSGSTKSLNWTVADGVLTLTGDGQTDNIFLFYENEMPWISFRDQITTVVFGEGMLSSNNIYFWNYPNLSTVIFTEQYVSRDGYPSIVDANWFRGTPLKKIIYLPATCGFGVQSAADVDFKDVTLYRPEKLDSDTVKWSFKEVITFCTYKNGTMDLEHAPKSVKIPVAADGKEAYKINQICADCGLLLNSTSYTCIDGVTYEGYEYATLDIKEHNEQQVRSYMDTASKDIYLKKHDPIFDTEPSVKEPYSAGVLSSKTRQVVLDLLNQYRYIAGVQDTEKVIWNNSYEHDAMAAALCLAVTKRLTHSLNRPAVWNNEKYNSLFSAASRGAFNSNIGGVFLDVTSSLIAGWISDTDSSLGHRHQLLKGGLKETGFGWADGYGAIYVDIFVSQTKNDWLAPSVWPGKATPLELYANALWHVNVGEDVEGDQVEVRIKGSNGFQAIQTNASMTAKASDGGFIIFSNPSIVKAGETYQITVFDHSKKKIWSYDAGFFSYTGKRLSSEKGIVQTLISDNGTLPNQNPAGSGTSNSLTSQNTTGPVSAVLAKNDAVYDRKSIAIYKVTKSDAKKGEVSYIRPYATGKTKIAIPSSITINGIIYKVTKIEKNAFKGNTRLTQVTIGSNVKSIGKYAFQNCRNLKKITIKSKKLTKKRVGTSAFKNIHKKAVVKVPAAKLKEYKKILKSKGISKKTQKIKKSS